MGANLQIHDRLTRELAESDPPPLGSLVADALVAGGRLRRRRRYTRVATGTAGVLMLVAAGVTFASNTGGVGTSNRSMPGAPGLAVSSTPARPDVVQTATTGEAAIALLIEMLPPGGRISEVNAEASGDYAGGSLLYDDGHGAATISIGVTDKPADYGPSAAGMKCPPNATGFTCRRSVTPDGNEVRVLTMGPYSKACNDPKCSIEDLRVEVRRADGTYVTADAYNGPFGHGRAATRTDTVLSADQLLAIANDHRWGLTMDASFVAAAKQIIASTK